MARSPGIHIFTAIISMTKPSGKARVLEIAFLPNGLEGCLGVCRLLLAIHLSYLPNLKIFMVNSVNIVFFFYHIYYVLSLDWQLFINF